MSPSALAGYGEATLLGGSEVCKTLRPSALQCSLRHDPSEPLRDIAEAAERSAAHGFAAKLKRSQFRQIQTDGPVLLRSIP
ncbi:MAG: hypothetical protein AB7G93_14805 [Bdellovibrionales bacterium]